MSKKGWGQIFAIATLGGLVAAGISYILQYKSFHKELEEEFLNFEEELPKEEFVKTDRNYVALNASRDEFVVAAKETAHAAKGMASAAKELIKDVGSIIKDQASNLKSVAADSAEVLKDRVEKRKKPEKNTRADESSDDETTGVIAASDDEAAEAIAAPDDKATAFSTSDDGAAQSAATSDEDTAHEDTMSAKETLVDVALYDVNPGATEISEQSEETFIPNLKIKEGPVQDVTIKDAKLKAEESTVIDLSVSKDEK